jgi:hypothetical protein
MNRLLLVNGAWVLVAIGAYLAGTLGRPAQPDSNAHRVPPPTQAASRSPADPPQGSAPDQSESTAATAAVTDWLRSYRDGGGAISAERMKEAVQSVLGESDPVKATLRFTHLLNELTPENALAALQALNEATRGADSTRYLSLLAHAWGALNGGAAVEALESLRRRDLDSAKTSAFAAWASKDPDAAMRWLRDRQSRSGADRGREMPFTRGMVTGLARRDTAVALDFVMTLPANERADLARLLAEHKMKENVVVGAEWAAQLPEEAMRVNAMETVGYEYIRQDLEGATRWAEKIAARPDAHEAVADVGNELATRNGPEAANWAAKLPPGPSQNHAMEDIFETWTRSDPLAASQGLTQMTPGTGRDAAIQAFSRTLSRENPTDALTWAGAMSDPKERVDLQVEIARRWQARAPADAQAWIAANLPPDAQARVLAPSRR